MRSEHEEGRVKGMTHEFSEDFIHTLGYLLEGCAKNNTDTIELHFDINGTKLSVEMTFKIDEDGGRHD